MNTVKLYKYEQSHRPGITVGYGFYPAEQPLDSQEKVYTVDDGGNEYALPDDGAEWKVSENLAGVLCLYRNEAYIAIRVHITNGCPQVSNGICYYTLRPLRPL